MGELEPITVSDPGQRDFYQALRRKIGDWLGSGAGSQSRWAEYLLAAPDLFHLLCKLALDADVSARQKAKLAGAIAYFVSPFDLIPEALVGPIGYVDDVAVAAWVLNSVMNESGQEVVLRHWAGERDVLRLVQDILKVANQMTGSGLWAKLRSRF